MSIELFELLQAAKGAGALTIHPDHTDEQGAFLAKLYNFRLNEQPDERTKYALQLVDALATQGIDVDDDKMIKAVGSLQEREAQQPVDLSQLSRDIFDELYSSRRNQVTQADGVESQVHRLTDAVMKHIAYHGAPEREAVTLTEEEKREAVEVMARPVWNRSNDHDHGPGDWEGNKNRPGFEDSIDDYREDARTALTALLERFELRRRS